jgi:hypothetical protein
MGIIARSLRTGIAEELIDLALEDNDHRFYDPSTPGRRVLVELNSELIEGITGIRIDKPCAKVVLYRDGRRVAENMPEEIVSFKIHRNKVSD